MEIDRRRSSCRNPGAYRWGFHCHSAGEPMRKDRGSVLISVLWIVMVLSLVSFSLASAVRIESASSQHAFDSERAFFMAKGAAEVVFNSLVKNLPIPTDSPIRLEKDEYIF